MGYLACILFEQNEDDNVLMTIQDMVHELKANEDLARAMDPHLEAVCLALGHSLKTYAIPAPTKADEGLH